jgi:hypothetical protein
MSIRVTKSQLIAWIQEGLDKKQIADRIGTTEYQVTKVLKQACLRVKRRVPPPAIILVEEEKGMATQEVQPEGMSVQQEAASLSLPSGEYQETATTALDPGQEEALEKQKTDFLKAVRAISPYEDSMADELAKKVPELRSNFDTLKLLQKLDKPEEPETTLPLPQQEEEDYPMPLFQKPITRRF